MNYNYDAIPVEQLISWDLIEEGVDQEITITENFELWYKYYDDGAEGFWQASIYDVALEEEVAVYYQDGSLEGLI